MDNLAGSVAAVACLFIQTLKDVFSRFVALYCLAGLLLNRKEKESNLLVLFDKIAVVISSALCAAVSVQAYSYNGHTVCELTTCADSSIMAPW